MSERVVLDASALVDALMGGPAGDWVEFQTRAKAVEAPGHLLAEVLSALGRRVRAGELTVRQVEEAITEIEGMRFVSHAITPLLPGAWARRVNLRLADALYVELADQLDTVVVTTDLRLARATPLAVAPPE